MIIIEMCTYCWPSQGNKWNEIILFLGRKNLVLSIFNSSLIRHLFDLIGMFLKPACTRKLISIGQTELKHVAPHLLFVYVPLVAPLSPCASSSSSPSMIQSARPLKLVQLVGSFLVQVVSKPYQDSFLYLGPEPHDHPNKTLKPSF